MSARPPSFWARTSRRLLIVLALGVALVIGIGLGEALHDRPDRGGTQTLIRTLEPLTIRPVPAKTVTVTTSAP